MRQGARPSATGQSRVAGRTDSRCRWRPSDMPILDSAGICQDVIQRGTALQHMLSAAIVALHRQGYTGRSAASKLIEWFPEASSADRCAGAEIALAAALLEKRFGPRNDPPRPAQPPQ